MKCMNFNVKLYQSSKQIVIRDSFFLQEMLLGTPTRLTYIKVPRMSNLGKGEK